MINDSQRRIQLFNQYQKMIYSALKKANVSLLDEDYEDLVQLGSIILLEQIDELLHDPSIDQTKWQGYMFQKIYWKMIDTLRKRRVNGDHATLTKEGILPDSLIFPNLEEKIFLKELMMIVENYLTPKERRLFYDLVNPELSRRQLAKNYGISPKTLYRHQHLLKEKIKKLAIWG